MRKLFVLLVVLAMSSVASAQIIDLQIASVDGLPIEPVKEIIVYPSQEVDIDIVLSGFTPGVYVLMQLDGIVTADGPGTLTMTVDSLTWPYDEGFNNLLELEAGNAYEVATGAFMGMTTDGIIVDHILLHYEDVGDVIVSIGPGTTWGGSFMVAPPGAPYDGAWGSVTIHEIPEPMTVALLGLGALALLRKNRSLKA